MYLSRFPWRALLLLWQLRIFAAAAARPDPTPPPFVGGGKYQKNKIACSVGIGGWKCLRRRVRDGRGGRVRGHGGGFYFSGGCGLLKGS